jgi:hypothetical protein
MLVAGCQRRHVFVHVTQLHKMGNMMMMMMTQLHKTSVAVLMPALVTVLWPVASLGTVVNFEIAELKPLNFEPWQRMSAVLLHCCLQAGPPWQNVWPVLAAAVCH